ncbi:MAG: hypothetical protein ACFFC1_19745, partial [Promethearchaeota archaeon]
MLRQVYILRDEKILYNKNFGKAISEEDFNKLYQEIMELSKKGTGIELNSYDYIKYKIIFVLEEDLKLIFMFITDINDDLSRSKSELANLRKEFLDTFGDAIENLDSSLMELLDPIVDSIHRNLKTKISLVGFSGVGKTTTTTLICATEIPSVHIPTIT